MIEDESVDSRLAASHLEGRRCSHQLDQSHRNINCVPNNPFWLVENGGETLEEMLNEKRDCFGQSRKSRKRIIKMMQSNDADVDDDDDDEAKGCSIIAANLKGPASYRRRERHKQSPLEQHYSIARCAKQLVLISLALLLFASPHSWPNLLNPIGWAVAAHDDEYGSIQRAPDNSQGANNSDNYTQIPSEHNYGRTMSPEPEVEMDYGGSIATTTTATTTTTTSTTTTTRRPGKRTSILDSQLLPFGHFNVQQPSFSDLIKSWPPTLQQQAGSISAAQSRARSQQEARSQQAGRLPPGARQDDLADGWPTHNHLNEDLDDTILTADQAFELDQVAEPPSWINYLGDWADHIYVQLRQYMEKTTNLSSGDNGGRAGESKQQRQLKIETIDELLDDFYYDQYENSQVLYYGPQLVREGDMFEIGCYLPPDQPAEWTKSGRALDLWESRNISPRVTRRTDFLNAKQNFSLKIFVALLSDSGNYRCNRMSRKYHKLVVVSATASPEKLYRIQQRLLSVVNPSLMSSPPLSPATGQPSMPSTGPRFQANQVQRYNSHHSRPQSSSSIFNGSNRSQQQQTNGKHQKDHLIPGYLIVAGQPLVVDCNISDELVLRRLRENPHFQLAWFKNGKQLRLSPFMAAGQQLSHNPSPGSITIYNASRRISRPSASSSQPYANKPSGIPSGGGRLQLLLANGRRLFIGSAQYADAGDYLCSWSELQRQASVSDDSPSDASYASPSDAGPAQLESSPLAAGSLVQLTAPVKLRPFKSAYHVRESNELRLICLAQRGYPPAHISWYFGNQLVDGEFLRNNGDEFRVLHLQNHDQPMGSAASTSATSAPPNWPAGQSEGSKERRIVEINPVPSSKQQMQMTRNGQWIEYHNFSEDRYNIGGQEQQLKYLQSKLSQLAGPGRASATGSEGSLIGNSAEHLESNLNGQASISVLVIKSLNVTRHTSRYACRATTRANTDEVTTVIRVSATSTISIKPSSGRATLIPGQPLHLQCEKVGFRNAEFFWYRKQIGQDKEQLLEPGFDEFIEIHNDRITLHKPTRQDVGDYICRAFERVGSESKEDAVIRVRTQPYIEDFGIETSHTGQSSIITDGERLELSCTVSDQTSPVNITWLRSSTLDDERTMVPISETPATTPSPFATPDPFGPSVGWGQDNDIIIETLGNHSKRLVIPSVTHEHRSYYVCMADNGVTERARKMIYIRVKDKLVALWPFLGIVAELFILFTIIHIWETQRAYKEIRSVAPTSPTGSKRPASGTANVRPADRDRKLEPALLE